MLKASLHYINFDSERCIFCDGFEGIKDLHETLCSSSWSNGAPCLKVSHTAEPWVGYMRHILILSFSSTERHEKLVPM